MPPMISEPMPNIDQPRITGPVMDNLPTEFPPDDMTQHYIVGYLQERYEASRAWDRPFKEKCLIDWRNLNSRLPANWPYFWGLFMPETSMACHDTVENIMATVFPKDNFFDLRAVTGQTEVQTEIMRETERFALRRAKYKEKYFFWEQEAIFYGNSVIMTVAAPTWKKHTIEESIPDPYGYGLNIGKQRVTQNKLTIWPMLINISRWNTFPFPGPVDGGNMQAMPYFVVRRFLPLAAVKAMATRPWAMWQNTEKLKGNYSVNRSTGMIQHADDSVFEDLWQLLEHAGFNIGSTQADGPNCVKFCEVLYYFEAPPGEIGCQAQAVWCENQLLACEANPYENGLKPLADIKWHPIHTDLWECHGVPAEIRSYQDGINIFNAQRADRRELDIKPPRIVGVGAGITPLTKLTPWPGALIEAQGDPSQVRMLDFPNPNNELYREEDNAKLGIQRATRITNVSKGIADPSLGEGATKTARGIAFMQDASQRASAFKLLFHEEIGVGPQLMQTAQILQQTLEPETIIHLIDSNETLKKAGLASDRMMIRPDDIAGEWEFWAVGSSRTSEPTSVANNMLQFWPQVLQDPEHGQKFDRMEIFKDAHEMIFNRPMTKYLKPEEELAQLPPPASPPPKEMLPKYADTPPDVQRQLEEKAGLQPSQIGGVSKVEQTAANAAIEANKPKPEDDGDMSPDMMGQ